MIERVWVSWVSVKLTFLQSWRRRPSRRRSFSKAWRMSTARQKIKYCKDTSKFTTLQALTETNGRMYQPASCEGVSSVFFNIARHRKHRYYNHWRLWSNGVHRIPNDTQREHPPHTLLFVCPIDRFQTVNIWRFLLFSAFAFCSCFVRLFVLCFCSHVHTHTHTAHTAHTYPNYTSNW